MANYQDNPVSYEIDSHIDFSSLKVGIVVSEWNSKITDALHNGAVEALLKKGVKFDHIISTQVPGAYELPLGCQWLLESDVDAVISIGCVIQGDTPHFQFICDAVANGIMDLNLKYSKPVIFGVLTTDTEQQAFERAGGKHGNKGEEAAITALKMLAIKN